MPNAQGILVPTPPEVPTCSKAQPSKSIDGKDFPAAQSPKVPVKKQDVLSQVARVVVPISVGLGMLLWEGYQVIYHGFEFDVPNLDKQESCVICFEPLDKQVISQITPCNHFFCKACIEKWFKRAQTCPTCRGAHNGARPFRPLALPGCTPWMLKIRKLFREDAIVPYILAHVAGHVVFDVASMLWQKVIGILWSALR